MTRRPFAVGALAIACWSVSVVGLGSGASASGPSTTAETQRAATRLARARGIETRSAHSRALQTVAQETVRDLGAGDTEVDALAAFDPDRVVWRGLRYVATKFFLKAETTVRLELADRSRAAVDLQAPPTRTGALAPAERNAVVSLDTEAIGRRSTEEVWLRTADGTALQRLKVRHGNDGYTKLYRFTEAGVAYRRSSPASRDEAEAPPADWTKQSTGWFPEPLRSDECPAIAQPAALFYLLSAHRWDRATPGFEVCVFADKAFSLLRVRPVGRASIDVSVEGPRGLKRNGKVETVEVMLEAVPLDPAAVESIELLGLEGDIRMFLDPVTGVPLRIRGELSSLGTVDADLESIAGPQ